MPTPAIELQDLRKTFRARVRRGAGLRARAADLFAPMSRSVRAVDGVSLRVDRGERVAFIGPNGAGKSTTLKILAGILYPDSGTVLVDGLVPWRDRRALGFRIGTVFGQRSQLWYQLPARATFDLLAHVYELPRATRVRTLDALVSAFELEQLLDRPVRQLSLGERMRCEVAASLLHDPALLFLDEPTIGLDVSAKAIIRELLRDRSRRAGTTLLLTSHDTGDIEQVCDRVVIIHHGTVLFDASVDELKRRYLRQRRITVVTAAERFDAARLDGVYRTRVIGTAPHRLTIEMDSAECAIGALVQEVVKHTELRDLIVEDPPLDDVIRHLYARASG